MIIPFRDIARDAFRPDTPTFHEEGERKCPGLEDPLSHFISSLMQMLLSPQSRLHQDEGSFKTSKLKTAAPGHSGKWSFPLACVAFTEDFFPWSGCFSGCFKLTRPIRNHVNHV